MQLSEEKLEAMLKTCVPGGSLCDPQAIADDIREWFSAALRAQADARPVGKVLSEEEMGIGYDRRTGPVVWFGTPKPGLLYTAPPAESAGVLSDEQVLAVAAALESARVFIRNGVALGYIRMPDADCPDPAHGTLPLIERAMSILSRTYAADGEAATQSEAIWKNGYECGLEAGKKAAQQQAEPESVIMRQAQKIGELIADRDSWIEAHARLYRLYHDQSPKAGEEIHVNVEGGDVYTLPLQLSGMDKPRFVVHVPCLPQAEPGADDRVAFDPTIDDLAFIRAWPEIQKAGYSYGWMGIGLAAWRAAQSGQRAGSISDAKLKQFGEARYEAGYAQGFHDAGQRAGVAEDANLLRDAAEKGLDINQQPQLGCVEVWAGKGDDALVFREYYSGHADREAATKCALKRALAAPTQQQERSE
ncbi:hypothetical protein JYK21_29545 [Ralstonia pickettii]|nr:hypothetical protein [Ralstonia pickettii]